MNVIYKYPIAVHYKQTVSAPESATFLHVGLDPQGQLCVWASVNTNYANVDHDLYVVGTGYLQPESASYYVGTVVQGSFVWHVFA